MRRSILLRASLRAGLISGKRLVWPTVPFVEKPAFELVGKAKEFNVAVGEFKDKGRSFWKSFVDGDEYRRLCVMSAGKFGTISGAQVMCAYLPNAAGGWDPIVNALGVERRDGMDVAGFEVFTIPAATYAEFDCAQRESAAVNKRIYAEWFPAAGYERDDKPDIAAFFQAPWSRTVYVRWWIPVKKKS